MAETAEIAVISFDRFVNGSDADRRAVAKKVYDAFSSVGWVYISDHGIPQSRVDEVFDLVRAPPIPR
jgi:isopenicillin N synthase-like dioxygenase